MRDRKRIEEALAHDQKIGSLTSDLDTLFELAREGERMEAEIAEWRQERASRVSR